MCPNSPRAATEKKSVLGASRVHRARVIGVTREARRGMECESARYRGDGEDRTSHRGLAGAPAWLVHCSLRPSGCSTTAVVFLVGGVFAMFQAVASSTSVSVGLISEPHTREETSPFVRKKESRG